ncbi:Very short patch repair protein [Aquicella siphonis]|uniref:Very short patch repair protein n=2 Tax=Aquicella siphonis TaxID=254247 RepID=A0A5E4PEZ5_9COXI|nr:Very short patch repair protein [Aquicella siphonis]
MALVKSKNTKPEMLVRRLVHRMGYRYRLHKSDLPGKPDLVFVSRKKIIFVNGCFWHGHNCHLGRIPKSRIEFWTNKITGNINRDNKNIEKLRTLGWSILLLWECELKNREYLTHIVSDFLNDG